jgi:alkanesulfonate monooxygenase SsuD/methylene tetrahydromethanopterin reductase-like flavin-dependent oxidoreductase (luciferase family)
MTDRNRLTFGVKTSQMGVTYEDILKVWREADQMPMFEHAWLWDHMVPLRGDVRGAALEAWTLLAALAAQTSRLRLGVMVTSNRLRSATLLAKMAATVDVIAGGRLDFGIGVGGTRLNIENPAVREFEAYGVPLVSHAEAVADLAEACTIIRRMWTEDEPFDFAGRFYQLKGAVCEPKPVQKPHPPFMIAGGGERTTLRVVAEHADMWNFPAWTAEEFRRKNQVLDDHCAAIGRDPKEIVRSMQVIVRCADPAAPEATRDMLLELIDAGVTHLVLAAVPPPGQDQFRPAQWLAEEIIEPVLAQAAHR